MPGAEGWVPGWELWCSTIPACRREGKQGVVLAWSGQGEAPVRSGSCAVLRSRELCREPMGELAQESAFPLPGASRKGRVLCAELQLHPLLRTSERVLAW